ncbi:MAG: inositol monophosphatase [Calditrichaeota bacterium]|nr:MAG: inositol monophosphatase [Calditrichota bacterium]MBL1206003.1 inositol monophosphatase [Calditrichota bacterium]NOG45831.1 inositol monophosphatase [Calditrichota bacterium]
MTNFLETAKTAAIEAGKILTGNFGKVQQSEIRKKSSVDFLSFVDESSEKKIIEIIRSAFPKHEILAEESGTDALKNSYRWIIDPLDGTTNYLHNIPVFAVSIGLEFDDEIICGVVYNPITNEMFWAEKGQGAFFNGKPIRVSQTETLTESFIATGFPFKNKHILKEYLEVFAGIFEQSIGARRLGAAAIDLAYIASGKFDGYWEIGLKPWDMAAGSILIKEAGGTITDFWNKPYYMNSSYVLASNTKIHENLGEIIRRSFPFFKTI